MSQLTSDSTSLNRTPSLAPEPGGALLNRGGMNGETPGGAPPKKHWVRTIILSLVAAATIAGVIVGYRWCFYRWQNVVSDHAAVKGRVYEVGARIDGQIHSVNVEPGQWVTKDQVLIRLEDDHYVAAAREAQAAVKATRTQLDVENLSIAQSRRQLTLAVEHAKNVVTATSNQVEAALSTRNMWEHQCDRIVLLVKAGIDSTNDLDNATAQRDNARALVKVAQAQLTAAESDRDLAVAQLEGVKVREAGLALLAQQTEEAVQRLALAEADLAATFIKAPADGWVVDRIVQPGGLAKVGEPMISLWLGDPWIEAWVDENKLRRVHIGSPVDVTLTAFPKQKLTGKVEGIGVLADIAIQAEADPKANAVPATLNSFFIPNSMVPVRIAVANSPVRLQPGLSALVGIRDFARATSPASSSASASASPAPASLLGSSAEKHERSREKLNPVN